jgi:serine/threonine protein kinase
MPRTLDQGRFELVGMLGEGGMAEVWRAYDRNLQVHRAVKLLNPAFLRKPSIVRRFRTEASTMAGLRHPNITSVIDVREEDGQLYMVMEFIEGGSLFDRLRTRGAFTPRQACRLAREVCEALHAAHERGIVHRDVKPHNVLLTRGGQAKVTDFGIAQVAGSSGLTRTGSTMGTLKYMAPEQHDDAKNVDRRADIFGVGALLYTLLAGREPRTLFFVDDSIDLGQLPEPLARIIERATARKADDRYSDAAAMASALADCEADLPEDPPEALPLSEPSEPLPSTAGGTLTPPSAAGTAEDSSATLAPGPNTFAFEPGPGPAGDSDLGSGFTIDEAPPAEPRRRLGLILAPVILVGLIGLGIWAAGVPSGGAGAEAVPSSEQAPTTTDDEVVRQPAIETPPAPAEFVGPEASDMPPALEETPAEPAEAPRMSPAPSAAQPRARPSSEAAKVEVAAAELAPAKSARAEGWAGTTKATLMVNTRPWSHLHIDGVDMGFTHWTGELAVGAHQLHMRTNDGREKTMTTDVLDGPAQRLCWDFDRDASC